LRNKAAPSPWEEDPVLTRVQYGVIKKIEHFWKGLSSDRTQISALPPEQYGDRFLNFMTGITMSPEEAQREAEEKQNAEAVAAAERSKQRVPSWNSAGRKSSSNNIPAAPTHEPPPPPGPGSGAISPQAEETIRRAEHIASKAEKHGYTEQGVPERVIKTTGTASGGIFPSIAAATAPSLVATDAANQAILPIVEEPSEGSTNGEHDHSANRSGNATAGPNGRPVTPSRSGNPAISNMREPSRAPPTPPKTSGSMAGNGSLFGHGKRLTKPESADSGIGVHEMMGRARSGSQVSKYSDKGSVRGQMSRESLDKALPPLPAVNGPA